LGFLIGIAGAVALDAACISFGGDAGNPAGDATDEGNMKSSKFMASGCGVCACWSTERRSCAIPLGALFRAGRALAGTVGGGFISFIEVDLHTGGGC
jgi:hypothetical protein